MAPRIRLNITKPLPTISEAQEDTLEDIRSNTKSFKKLYVSPGSCSGEDYLPSICQLAAPSFLVLPESQQKIQDAAKPEKLHDSHRASNMSETLKIAPKYEVANTLLGGISLERNTPDHVKTHSSLRAEPLEGLYTDTQKTHYWRCPNSNESTAFSYSQQTCHGTSLSKSKEKKDVVSFPRFPSPRPMHRGNSSLELKSLLQSQGKRPALEDGPNQKENDPLIINGKPIGLHPPRENLSRAKILSCSQRERALNAATGSKEEQMKSFIYNQNEKREAINKERCVEYFYNSQKVTACHWISEYQGAWKEAKMRACLLPAILES